MDQKNKKQHLLEYKGCNYFRQRLVLSILSGRPVRLTEIRCNHEEPGLVEYEINLIRLLDKITNGTVIELNETGTTLYFQPGLLNGGQIEHVCSLQRSLGYYLEVLLMLGLFCKTPLNVVLKGVTCNNIDPSVDVVKASMVPVLKKFLIDDEGLDLKIVRRGMSPRGGGEVIFKCPVRKELLPVQLTDSGLVKRVRGIAFALSVSPAMANRMVDSAKEVLLKFLPDVYINTDHTKGKSNSSPGFGINLVAETNKGVFYSIDQISHSEDNEPKTPEDIGTQAAHRLLHEIYLGGVVDSSSQSLALLLMSLGKKDVSKLHSGPLSDYTIWFLRHLKEFFGVTFSIETVPFEDETVTGGCDKIMLTCVGIGYTNLSKRTI